MDERGRVVVGIDDSPGSRVALAHALREAARRGAEIEAIAVFASPEYPIESWAPFYGPPPVPLEEVRADVWRAAERIVGEVVGELPAGLPVPHVEVRAVAGGAADVLLQAAEFADLLVVGSRGRGGFRSMLLGSVSMACALHSPCPVTIVRPPKHAATDKPKTVQSAASGG